MSYKLKMVRGTTFACSPILGDILVRNGDVVAVPTQAGYDFLKAEKVEDSLNNSFNRFEDTDEELTYPEQSGVAYLAPEEPPLVDIATSTQEDVDTGSENLSDADDPNEGIDPELLAHLNGTGEDPAGEDTATGSDGNADGADAGTDGAEGEGSDGEGGGDGTDGDGADGAGDAGDATTTTPPKRSRKAVQ
jgi:hypothetical protein